jgi:hypothetical protein
VRVTSRDNNPLTRSCAPLPTFRGFASVWNRLETGVAPL